jgi:hypothetical protein
MWRGRAKISAADECAIHTRRLCAGFEPFGVWLPPFQKRFFRKGIGCKINIRPFWYMVLETERFYGMKANHTPDGSNPARRYVICMAYPGRAEIFALPGLSPFRLLAP